MVVGVGSNDSIFTLAEGPKVLVEMAPESEGTGEGLGDEAVS
jgi:hypothetical protein